ncbi:MAG: glycoside hydrolase family 5 protein [Mariniphaga sp.]|nr:glycoside hydrolase family 5 protein [Mariniphaga sp.]
MKPKQILVFLIILTIGVGALYSQPVKKHGKLSVKGINLVDENNEVIMLQGVSYGWHNFWPRFYNKESVKWLRDDWACTVIRAAMGVEPNKGYISSPDWSKEKIEAVVNSAIENDIYIIIDWHSHHIKLEEAKIFFTEMAKKYGKYPHIIYEIYNEPERDTWQQVKDYSIEMIKTIRQYDPDNIILVGNPHWSQDVHIVADDPIEGFENIMYTLHFYADTHKQSLRERGDYALKKGIPLFVSESAGMLHTGDGPINIEEWQRWIDWMRANKVSWVSWSVSDKDETCSMLKQSAASEGGWTENDMKESGIKTRELLRKFAGK